MTVTYRHEIGTSGKIGTGCWRLLRRWQGSIYRLLWTDLLVYFSLYSAVSIIYRLVLNEEHKMVFERLVEYFDAFSVNIPLAFLLGFYCSLVVGRWWMQYQTIPWPDTLCMNVTTNLKGQDARSRMMRHNIARYVNLAINISFTKMSPEAASRFETLDKFVEEGFLTPNEKEVLERYRCETKNCEGEPLSNYWIPLVWASSIVNKARDEGKIVSDIGYTSILADLRTLRSSCGQMQSFAWINVPLAYTQVVAIAVYGFCLTTIIGRQYIGNEIDLYIPFITLFQVIFYLGWFRTAEALLNPFGDDDDDFEILYLIDRNHQMGYAIVDMLHSGHPELSHDIHWDSVLPPTAEAMKQAEVHSEGHTDSYVPVPLGFTNSTDKC